MLRISPFNIYVANSDFTGKTFLINILEIHWNDCNISLLEIGWWEGKFTWDLLFWGFWRRYVYKLWYKLFPPKKRVYDEPGVFPGLDHLIFTGYEYVVRMYVAGSLEFFVSWESKGVPLMTNALVDASHYTFEGAQNIAYQLSKAGHGAFISKWEAPKSASNQPKE